MDNLQQTSYSKEALQEQLTQLESQIAQLETQKTGLQQDNGLTDAQNATADAIYQEIEEIANISAYFANTEQYPEDAPKFARIHRMATARKEAILGELNAWNNQQMDARGEVQEQIATIDASIEQLQTEARAVERRLEEIDTYTQQQNEQEATRAAQNEAFIQNIKSKAEFVGSMEQLQLTWTIHEQSIIDGNREETGSVDIHIHFEKLSSSELNKSFWLYKRHDIIAPTAGVFALEATVQAVNIGNIDQIDFHSGSTQEQLKTELTITLKLTANPVTFEQNESSSRSENTAWEAGGEAGLGKVLPGGNATFSRGGGDGWEDTTGESSSYSTQNAVYIRVLKYVFVNTGDSFECDLAASNETPTQSIGDWSDNDNVHYALNNGGLQGLVLRDELNSEVFKKGFQQ